MKMLCWGVLAVAMAATPAAAENWNPFSRTPSRAYLADVDSITTAEGITSIQSASTPMVADAGDLSHSRETYQFQCAEKKWRTAGAAEHGPDGAQLDVYPEEGAAWEEIRRGTLPDYLMQIACDGARASGQTWPTINAFIEAGRP